MDIVLRRATESDIEIVQAFGAKLLNYERENYDPSLYLNNIYVDEGQRGAGIGERLVEPLS